MIVFLSFAPIEFMGGFERWVEKIVKNLSKKEDISVINMSSDVANIYGRMVLSRKFDARREVDFNVTKIDLKDLIPFSVGWQKLRRIFKRARIVYIKYELPELMLLFYFGGWGVCRKTIAGIHSALLYEYPEGFWERMHKLLYESRLSLLILRQMKIVHVINKKVEAFLNTKSSVDNVRYIPDGVMGVGFNSKRVLNNHFLKIIFVGELSVKKGADVLMEVVKEAPGYLYFEVIGDGVLKKDVVDLVRNYDNCRYLGYVESRVVFEHYLKSDILFMPSKAESMSLVALEAMSAGVAIVDSTATQMGLPSWVEYVNKKGKADGYIRIFKRLLRKKQDGLLRKKEIGNYFEENFSDRKVIPELKEGLFNID